MMTRIGHRAAGLVLVMPPRADADCVWVPKSGGWEAKEGVCGPGPNRWCAANAQVAGGGVSLQLTQDVIGWCAAEVRRPAGYGRWSIEIIGRPDLFDQNVVLGLFFYNDAAGCPAEIDVELGRFGNPAGPNGHYVLWPRGKCPPIEPQQCDFNFTLTGTFTTHPVLFTAQPVLTGDSASR